MVLLGVRTCAPFEGGIACGWVGSLPNRWIGGEEGGFRKTARHRQALGLPDSQRGIIFNV